MSGQKILSVKQKGGHESRSPKVSELKLRDSLVGSVRRLVRGQHQPHWAQANVKVVLLIPATCRQTPGHGVAEVILLNSVTNM